MYESIKQLQPYFYSLREINNKVSLDIKLPLSWKYDAIVFSYKGINTQVQDKNDKFNLLSLISVTTKEGYDMVLACATEIISVNKDEEEKRKLYDLKIKELNSFFEQKVNELKTLFQSQSLEALKELNYKPENEREDTHNPSVGLVEQGDKEGREASTEEQGKND